MYEPLQKSIDRALGKAQDEIRQLKQQQQETEAQHHRAEDGNRETSAQLQALHEQELAEQRKLAERRTRIRELQRQIEDEQSGMRAQEDLHAQTSKRIRESRKQAKSAQRDIAECKARINKINEKQRKHANRLQASLERYLCKYLEDCWDELRQNMLQHAQSSDDEAALERLETTLEHDDELRGQWEHLDFWERTKRDPDTPQSMLSGSKNRIAEIRAWLEERYPGAVTARDYRDKAKRIPGLAEIFYHRYKDNCYILPLPILPQVWAAVREAAVDTDVAQDQTVAMHLFWAVLEQFRNDHVELSVRADGFPVLHCRLDTSESFPETLNIQLEDGDNIMDLLLSPAPPRLQDVQLLNP